MNGCDWENLPSVVLIHLYQYLPHNDRITVSTVCQHWREAFWFYPSWRKLNLNAASCSATKNAFLVEKYSKTCRSLCVTFVDGNFLHNVGEILRNWTVHRLISEFQMLGSANPSHLKGSCQSILYPFLEKCGVLKELVLSYVENPARLAAVLENNASTLKSLSIGLCINGIEDEISMSTARLLAPLANISILQLDCSWLTEDSLSAIANLPLQRFIVAMLASSTIHPISENSWHSFNSQLRHCEIRITCYKMNNTALSASERNFFSGTAVATHVRFIYCSHRFQEACINALMKERVTTHTITTIWAIMDPKDKSEISLPHPFVVCAWRFKHLRELVLSGAAFDKYDLEGMARMRPGLKIHIAKEEIIWELSSEPRLLTPPELSALAKALKPSKGDVWIPMDEKRFNNPSISFKDREVMLLRQVYLDDFKTKFHNAPSSC